VPSNTYDLIVLGDDLAALACATLCARRGMRTLVLGEDRPARYQLGPHKLPIELSLWPVHTGSAGDRILKELHAEMAIRRKLREPRIAAQIVAPQLRLDLGGDRLASELAREVGDDAEAWSQLWQRGGDVARTLDPLLAEDHAFPGVGFFERRETTRIAEAVADAAAAWWRDAAGNPHVAIWKHVAAIALRHPSPPPAAIARALDAWRVGPPALRGEGDAVRALLGETRTPPGGEIRVGKVESADVSWSKIASLKLVTGEDLGAGQVVTSRAPAELVELLGKKAPKRLSELAEGQKLVGYRYTLNVVLDAAGVPEHMAPTVAVVAAPDREPIGDVAFALHLGESDEGGRVVVTLAAVVAADETTDADRLVSRAMALRAGLWHRLGDVMPFFEKHLVLAHSPFDATPPHVPGGRGSYDVPRSLPLAMTPVWSGELASTAQLGCIAYTTGLKNLTLTGEQILPSLGVEGALVAGWSAAKIACALGGKKKDYLRDEIVGTAG
jgi:hypothetical protein